MLLAVEPGQKPMSIVITAGQRGDSPQFEPVLKAICVPRIGPGRPRVRPDRVRADKAYARDDRSHRGHQRVAVTSCHTKPARMACERQEFIAARSDSLRRTQNSLPSGSARTAQPEPSGFR
ncbi:transposase [Streptomyces sp. NBC_01669]|nr:transposase [Streptomyces sp. NBC_01669]